MKRFKSEKGLKQRQGVEIKLVPESEEDQASLDELDAMLKKPEFRDREKSPILWLFTMRELGAGYKPGKSRWIEYHIGIYYK